MKTQIILAAAIASTAGAFSVSVRLTCAYFYSTVLVKVGRKNKLRSSLKNVLGDILVRGIILTSGWHPFKICLTWCNYDCSRRIINKYLDRGRLHARALTEHER
jgi:hypothetical protein